MISFAASVMSLTNPFVFFFLRRKNRPEFENGRTLKTRQMFSLHTTLETFENVTLSGHILDLCLKKIWTAWEITFNKFRDVIVFEKYFRN